MCVYMCTDNRYYMSTTHVCVYSDETSFSCVMDSDILISFILLKTPS